MRVSVWIRPALVTGVAILLLAACGGSAQGSSGGSGSASKSTPTPTPAVQNSPVKTETATVQGKSETIFTNDSGMTLYYYMPDKDSSVTCTGGCAAAWPPLMAGSSSPGTMTGVTGTWGSVANPAGGSVVTYNGWPLYTFVKDTAPGQTTGEGVGGAWFVATPSLAASTTGTSY